MKSEKRQLSISNLRTTWGLGGGPSGSLGGGGGAAGFAVAEEGFFFFVPFFDPEELGREAGIFNRFAKTDRSFRVCGAYQYEFWGR